MLILFTAQSWAAQFSLGTGFDYSSGDYSGTRNIKIWYYPVTAKLVSGPATIKLTVPYLHVTAPANQVVIINDGLGGSSSVGGESESEDNQGSGSGSTTSITTNTLTTRDGLGDVLLSATYNLWDDRARPFGLDVGGKIKFGTADTAKGLGTGKNDYSLYMEIFRQWDNKLETYLNAGYRWYGDTATINFRNVWQIATGFAYPISRAASLGLDYGYRERILATADAPSEATAFFNYKFMPGYKLQIYTIKGFSKSSPDWGGGMMFTLPF